MSCVFCSIVKRELPASFIYEDDKAAAFLDIHPITEGHVLIVPKSHEAQFGDLIQCFLIHKMLKKNYKVRKVEYESA